MCAAYDYFRGQVTYPQISRCFSFCARSQYGHLYVTSSYLVKGYLAEHWILEEYCSDSLESILLGKLWNEFQEGW